MLVAAVAGDTQALQAQGAQGAAAQVERQPTELELQEP
jgi:hypothetical protein